MGAAKKIENVVSTEIAKMNDDQRSLVLVWAKEAKEIQSDKSLTKKEKLLRLHRLRTAPVIKLLLKMLGKSAKEQLWDKRSWPGRLALGGLAVGVGAAGSKGAGIAALGTAVGVKLYLLTSAGGALLGTIIQEVERARKK